MEVCEKLYRQCGHLQSKCKGMNVNKIVEKDRCSKDSREFSISGIVPHVFNISSRVSWF